MFWGEYRVIWWFIIGLVVVALLLVRMGVRTFNREEILAKEMDDLNVKTLWRDFWGYFLRPPALATQRESRASARFNLLRIYTHDIPTLIKTEWLPLAVRDPAKRWLPSKFQHNRHFLQQRTRHCSSCRAGAVFFWRPGLDIADDPAGSGRFLRCRGGPVGL
jgi:hypothetical protein